MFFRSLVFLFFSSLFPLTILLNYCKTICHISGKTKQIFVPVWVHLRDDSSQGQNLKENIWNLQR